MADRIVVLDGGSISQVGAPLELYHKPDNLFVAGFIGNPRMNFIPGTCIGVDAAGARVELITGGALTVPVAATEALIGQKVTLGIRPEHLSVTPGDMALTMTPTVVERLGVNTVAYCDLPGVGTVSALLDGSAPVQVDQPTPLHFVAADCHLFDAEGLAVERSLPADAQAAMPEMMAQPVPA